MQNCKHVAPIHYVASRQYRTKITEKPKSDTPDLDREVSQDQETNTPNNITCICLAISK